MVGLAFQIRDDILDYTGRKSITGKPTGLDLSEKKLTLPLVHALCPCAAVGAEGDPRNDPAGGKKIDVRRIVAFRRTAGRDRLCHRTRAALCRAQAQEQIAGFPDSPSRTSLMAFADFVVDREK